MKKCDANKSKSGTEASCDAVKSRSATDGFSSWVDAGGSGMSPFEENVLRSVTLTEPSSYHVSGTGIAVRLYTMYAVQKCARVEAELSGASLRIKLQPCQSAKSYRSCPLR